MSGAKNQSWWLTLARGEANAWTVVMSKAQPSGTRVLTYVEEELEASVTATVRQATAHVTDIIWRHELAAYAYQNQSRTLGMARQLVHASHETNCAGLAALHPSKKEANAVAFAVRAMLGRQGRVRGLRKQIRLEQVKWLVAAIAAWPALMASILRYGGTSPERLRPAEVVHAVHGEWETRTRHLLPPSYDPGQDPQYLIIGRPRRSLRDIAVMLGEKSGLKDANLIRPLDVSAAVRALIPGLCKIVHGIDVAASGPIQAGWRDCWALTYRKRPRNDLICRCRFRLDVWRRGGRRYCVGFSAAGSTLHGSIASMSARVFACGSFSKMWRRYANGSSPAALQVSMML